MRKELKEEEAPPRQAERRGLQQDPREEEEQEQLENTPKQKPQKDGPRAGETEERRARDADSSERTGQEAGVPRQRKKAQEEWQAEHTAMRRAEEPEEEQDASWKREEDQQEEEQIHPVQPSLQGLQHHLQQEHTENHEHAEMRMKHEGQISISAKREEHGKTATLVPGALAAA